MRAFGYQLAAVVLAFVGGIAQAQVTINADIGVTITAVPTTNLTTGEPINFTVTVTNYGPQSVSSLILQSSTFVNEFGQFITNPNECFLFLTVVDAVPTPYQYVNWPVAINGEPSYPPLAVGETRTCHFQFALTPQAPASTLFSFGVPSYFMDLNPSNDTGTVVLERAIEPVVPLPALSPAMLLLLSGIIIAAAGVARRKLAASARARTH